MATIMTHDQFEVITKVPMELGECPLWHPLERVLYWIDIDGRAVHRFDPVRSLFDKWPMPSEPGCIAWCAHGELLVALRHGLAVLNTASGELSPLAPAPYDTAKVRFNDGRCDSAGRLWVGTLYEPRNRPGGSLFRLERGKLSDESRPVTVSNGVAFSNERRLMYHTDTTAHRISTYDFDVTRGTIGGARTFKQFDNDKSAPSYGGRPDGAAIDSEGAYWCAMFEGSRILRLSASGDLLQELHLPVRCPTMIAFGGADLRTLYVTSARHNRPAQELDRLPLSGHVLALRVDIAGLPEHPYQI
jgi:sugar lactone lactonase YvrE